MGSPFLLPAVTILSLPFNNALQDFPGSPVVKTLRFHCRGHGFDPWSVQERKKGRKEGRKKGRKERRKKERKKTPMLFTSRLLKVLPASIFHLIPKPLPHVLRFCDGRIPFLGMQIMFQFIYCCITNHPKT